jgi:hypothetical protein
MVLAFSNSSTFLALQLQFFPFGLVSMSFRSHSFGSTTKLFVARVGINVVTCLTFR